MLITKYLNFPDALITTENYQQLYQQSITEPEIFLAEQGEKYLT